MKAAWSDEPRVTFDGRFRQVDDLPIQPKPVQRPHPPIWFGGQAPKALARAVRHGDAFLGAGSSTTAKFAEAVTTVRRELAEQGKDRARFPDRQAGLSDDRRRRRPRRANACSTGCIGSTAGCPASTTFRCPAPSTMSSPVCAKSSTRAPRPILLNPVGRDVAEDREQMERLAAEVIPQLR